MAEYKQLTGKDSTVGDAVVDGLWGGVLAGVVMLAYLLLIAGLAIGEGPTLVLGYFDPGGGASPITGALAHLAVAGVYGIIFGLVWRLILRWRRPPVWLVGLLYGLALLILAETVTLRVPDFESSLLKILLPHFALAHILYGLALGFLMGRSREARTVSKRGRGPRRDRPGFADDQAGEGSEGNHLAGAGKSTAEASHRQ